MENNNGRRKPPLPKKNPKEIGTSGASAIHLAEDTASKLVGGIIEKGISSSDTFTTPSSSSSFPQPSPFAFPLARHRSHGPHWTPATQFAAANGGVDDDSYDEDDEESNRTNYEPLADFANPLKRKKKKGLDFSKWKEVISSDIVLKDEEDGNKGSRKTVEKQMGDQNTKNITVENSLGYELPMDLDSTNDPLSHSILENKLVKSSHNDVNTETAADIIALREKQPSASSGSNGVAYAQGQTSLESQIDAENRALLETMSREEIVEAQSEIRNKMNPKLLNLLKKRGLQKSEKQQVNSDIGDSVITLADSQTERAIGEKWSPVPKSIESPSPATPPEQNIQTKPDEGGVQDLPSKGGSEWNSWSKRVEAVRNLRFSLDGNVIEGYYLGPTYTSENVAERDFLRTEGDPAAAGYTIKEALALARSVVPGQRALGLQLVASVLHKALHNLCRSQLDRKTSISKEMNHVAWEAIWAYALGPEPELVLSLRLAIDDNHQSVVLAAAKVIQCMLACDVNEDFFNFLTKLARNDLYTAPVFRSRPEIKDGFLGGRFWKYSTKPSNIVLLEEEVINDNNGEHTIQDDNVIANQDVAAGLVRMGILPRLLYLLETEPSAALEECILSILVAVARHSPTCANAVWNCERLVETIVNKYNLKDTMDYQGSKVKSVTLLRVLAQSSKTICVEFINRGFFQIVTWQLYRVTRSIEEWLNLGRENCKLASELMLEQLRFWKVCIKFGCCISYFTSFFPALCLWLSPPTFDKLTEAKVFEHFASVTTELYLVLETLASRLPDLYSLNSANKLLVDCGDNSETWCWSDVRPMFDCALQWLQLNADTTLSSFFSQLIGEGRESNGHNACASSFLWILSAVLHFLHSVLVKATPENVRDIKDGSSLLPEFVSKLAFLVINNGFVIFPDQIEEDCSVCQPGVGFLLDNLCYFKHKSDPESSVASVSCLNAFAWVVASIDHFIQLTEDKVRYKAFQGCEFDRENKILDDGIYNSSSAQWRKLLYEFMDVVTSEWHVIPQIEVFGRGGLAPGVGVGWGALGGGFWSVTAIAFQADARLFIDLLRIYLSSFTMGISDAEDKCMMQIINSALASGLMMGPGDKVHFQKMLDILLQAPVLNYLDQHISRLLQSNHGQHIKWEDKEGDLTQFGKILASHFTRRWFTLKKKKRSEAKDGDRFRSKMVNSSGNSLASIPEDMETTDCVNEDCNQIVKWARQRMPLPIYWLCSPLTTIGDISSSNSSCTSTSLPPVEEPEEFLRVAKAGLFFLLGIEAMSSSLSDDENSPLRSLPLVWRFHSLSVPLLAGMGVLEEERSRVMFETLQTLYGQYLDTQLSSSSKASGAVADTSATSDLAGGNCLRFQSEIHESYSTFIEALVEQFAAISYGDPVYARQIAIYLHRQVDAPVRLATWNALSNSCVLELLPPIDKCVSRAEGYLEPVEDNDDILEAYVKSWVSGALDRSATRGSMTYTIVIHHLSSFIFDHSSVESILLRNKLVKSLLRDYARKKQHEAMMVDLIQHDSSVAIILKSEHDPNSLPQLDIVRQRLELLKEACEGNSQLLAVVEKLKTCISIKQSSG